MTDLPADHDPHEGSRDAHEWAMLIMAFAFWAYCVAAAMHRLRTQIIEREQGAAWLTEAVK